MGFAWLHSTQSKDVSNSALQPAQPRHSGWPALHGWWGARVAPYHDTAPGSNTWRLHFSVPKKLQCICNSAAARELQTNQSARHTGLTCTMPIHGRPCSGAGPCPSRSRYCRSFGSRANLWNARDSIHGSNTRLGRDSMRRAAAAGMPTHQNANHGSKRTRLVWHPFSNVSFYARSHMRSRLAQSVSHGVRTISVEAVLCRPILEAKR